MCNANRLAYEKLIAAEPVLIGCRRAGEVVKGLKKNVILHSGPEIEFAAMRGPHTKRARSARPSSKDSPKTKPKPSP